MNKYVEAAKKDIWDFSVAAVKKQGNTFTAKGVTLSATKSLGNGFTLSIVKDSENFVIQHISGETERDVYLGVLDLFTH